VIAADAIDAALHGVNQEAALQGCGTDSRGEAPFGWEGTLARFVGDEFHRPEQADAAHIADCVFVAQSFQPLLELGSAAGAARVGGFDQLFRLQIPQHGAASG